MSILQAILCSIVYWMGSDCFVMDVSWLLSSPLGCGFIVGIILGDPTKGAVVGGTINLLFLGFISAGGSLPSDPVAAGTLGTALAISGNLTTEAALAIAVPLSLIGTVLWQIRMTTSPIFVHLSDRFIEKGQYKMLHISQLVLPWAYTLLLYGIPCFLAAYFGATYVQRLVDVLSGTVLNILNVVGGLMPAIGISITLQYIFKGETCIFLFLGFVIAAISGQSLLILGVLGFLVAVAYVQLKPEKGGK